MRNDKDGGNLGSDGETSDYQRSTPSPQDSNARITELSEGNNNTHNIGAISTKFCVGLVMASPHDPPGQHSAKAQLKLSGAFQ